MKRIFSSIIMIALLLSMSTYVMAGQSAASSAQGNSYISLPYGVYDKVPADEIQRAIFFGLVPIDLQSKYTNQITFKEFCALTRSMLNKYNAKTLSVWDNVAKNAVKSARGMLRQDAFAPLMFAAQQMSIACKMGKDTDWGPQMDKTGEPWNDFTWQYPEFSSIAMKDINYCAVKFNYTSAGYMLTITKRSWLSGNALYDYDQASNSMRVKDKLTRAEAIKAVLRLAENTKYPILTGRQPQYMNVSSIGSYNKNIITDQLLNTPSKLPVPSRDKLPMWRGAGNSLKSIRAHGYADYRESDVRFLSENGYNFMRVMSSYASYSFPGYPKDVEQVNRFEFDELDQLIAWGIKYNVHMSILMQDIYIRQAGLDNYMDENSKYPSPQDWKTMQDYWTALAKRYKGISNQYINFDLLNEWNPSNLKMTEQFKADWKKVIDAIRAVDPDRLLIASFDKDVAAAEAMAELGVDVAEHPYYPYIMTGADDREIKDYKYPIDRQWPMQYFPSLSFMNGDAPINITGVEAGGTLSIAAGETGSNNTAVDVYGDSKLIGTIQINSPGMFDGDAVSITIPQGIQKLTLKKTNGWLTLNCIMFESNGRRVTMMPHDFAFFREAGGEVNLKINGNGTWENADGKVVDANSVYEMRIKPFEDAAAKNGVGFMIDEFGPYISSINNSQLVKYTADLAGLMEQKHIPYCYCELIMGNGYRTIISLDGSFALRNAKLQKLTYSYPGGLKDTFWYNKELMDAMKSIIIK